jgi:hypothetical protein
MTEGRRQMIDDRRQRKEDGIRTTVISYSLLVIRTR